MARFFFNISDGEELLDDVGVELSSVAEVPAHMLKVAQAWMEEEQHRNEDWHLEARDERENQVLSVRFGPLADDA